MTIAELLALLGRYWSRLLLYPGGLGVLVAFLLITRHSIWQARLRHTTQAVSTVPGDSVPFTVHQDVLALRHSAAAELTALAVPWLGLALLPLPLAVSVGRSVDLVVALALLEWPRLLVAIREAQMGQIDRLAAVLNSYPALIGALLLLALPVGSLDVATIGQAPNETASLTITIAHWLGALSLMLGLPPLLGLGPFSSPPPAQFFVRLGLAVRSVGLVTLVALPFAGLIPEALRWLLPLPVGGVGLVAWGLHWLGRHRAALPWAQALLWLCAIEGVVLLLAGVEGLALRLR